MGYRLNRLDEPVFMAGPKPLRTEFGIHLRLESCEWGSNHEPRASEEDALSTPPRRHLAGSIEVIS